MKGGIYLLKLFKSKQIGEIVAIKEYLKNRLYPAVIRDEVVVVNKYKNELFK